MVGLIDCDNFFCSCERVFRPDLRDKPIVVLSNNDGCVVARSKEVKAMGIKDCLPYYQLLEKYPNAGITAFSSNYALYGDMSARVMAVLREEVPEVLQYSIDEAFLDLEGMDRLDLKVWGEKLCKKVEHDTGMPISLGIGSTKTLAKLAARFSKRYPGYKKCCVIGTDEQRVKALRLTYPRDVWGIGRRMCVRMESMGIRTAYDFTLRPKHWVRSKFHITGERTWMELRGEKAIDVDGLDNVERQTIVTSRSFPGMLTEMADLRSHVANYGARCALKLRKQNSVCATVTVFIQSNHFRLDLPQYDNSASCSFMTSTNTTSEIAGAAVMLLEKIYRKGIPYKRGGVMVSGITSGAAIQPDLFTYDAHRQAKYRAISSAIDAVNRRNGADAVMLGSQQYREKGVDGKSVKFVNAIRRALKSPEYTTRLGAFVVK